MEILSRNNRTYLSLRDEYGKTQPFQCQIYAKSGYGKGLASEMLVEKWKEATNGIVLYIADPKNEAEATFCQYLPKERYHTERLKLDGVIPKTYSAKVYHPFTFNIPEGFLPEINFFTLSIKDMSREEWSILAETSFDSETIKLLMRVSHDLKKNDGLFNFLHEIQRLVKGVKNKKLSNYDPKNFYLSVGAGTSKSITEVAGLLSPFKTNYFLRKDSCDLKLDWKNILTDNKNYHVFLSMWLKDEKLQQFMVLSLLKQVIENRHFAKKPILLVIPEIRVLCPIYPQGYKLFLSTALTNALSTIRSMGRGIFSLSDSQNWEGTDKGVKGSATITFFGELSTSDSEAVCKAMQYQRPIREQLQSMNYRNSYLMAGKENENAFRFFYPSHRHKEADYNWIETYKEFFSDKMVRYSELKKQMQKEIEKEEEEIRIRVEKILQEELAQIENKKNNKEEKKEKPVKKEVEEDKDKQTIKKLCHEMFTNTLLDKKDRTFRAIGRKLNINHLTVKKYILNYKEPTADEHEETKMLPPDDFNFGEGILPEEIEENFG